MNEEIYKTLEEYKLETDRLPTRIYKEFSGSKLNQGKKNICARGRVLKLFIKPLPHLSPPLLPCQTHLSTQSGSYLLCI